MICQECGQREATTTKGYPQFKDEFKRICHECYITDILEFYKFSIEEAMNAWKRELKSLKEGDCGTFWDEHTIPYREFHIKYLEDMFKYTRENLK